MRFSNLASLLAVALLLPAALSQADTQADPGSDTQANAPADTTQQQANAPSTAQSKATYKKNVAALKKACKGDVEKLCSDVTPGEGRIMSCFDAKSDQLSPGCKKEWTATQANISEKMDKANLAFRKNCGGDINKYCSTVPQGRGRILDCLNLHEDNLSQSCKNLQATLKQRAAQYLG